MHVAEAGLWCGAAGGGDGGPSVVPGKPGESLLIQAVKETDEALRFLLSRGCRQFQGFLFGKPEPINRLHSRLHTPQAVEASG